MGSKAIEWARTHKFENGAVARTAILRFLAEQADDDGYIADHEGDKGVAFIMHETCASKSTTIRILKEFEEADLLHRERRPYKKFGGRPTDLIVLHLYNMGNKTPWRTLKALKQIHKAGQEQFGAPVEELGEGVAPVDNSQSALGVTLTPSYESSSQTLGVTLTPSATQGVTLTHTRCHSDILDESALKGTRVRTIPIDYPSQSVVLSGAPVDNSQADGLTDREMTEQKNSPARPEQLTTGLPATTSAAARRFEHQSPEEKSPIIHGVKLSALRSMLEAKHGFSLGHISDAALGRMVTIVVSRASAPVRSPLAFAVTAISFEIEELHSLALSLLEAEAAQDAPREFCNTHTREFTGSCPLCAKEATGQLKILTPESSEPAPVDRQAGVAFRESIRARRKAQNGSPVKNSAQEHPGLGGRIPLKSPQGPLKRPESPSVA